MNSLSVGIGITTRDRWPDLAQTLTALSGLRLSGLETVVIDDGSAVPVPDALRLLFPWVTFERSASSQGYIVQRNRLARLLKADYYLSLDDDSFPVAGDLAGAVKFLDHKPEVVGLAFSIVLRDEDPPGLIRVRRRFVTTLAAAIY